MRAMSVLASVASDFDLIADWLFYIDVYQNDQVPKKIAFALLTFCIISIFTWLMLASDGRVVRPIFEQMNKHIASCKVRNFSTGCILVTGLVLEDIPQCILTLIIGFNYDDEDGLSNLAVVNVMTSIYDMLIKLAEAMDERNDLISMG